MTILPKKKSSAPKADRESAGGAIVDSVPFSPRGLSQSQVRHTFFCIIKYFIFMMADHLFTFIELIAIFHFVSFDFCLLKMNFDR